MVTITTLRLKSILVLLCLSLFASAGSAEVRVVYRKGAAGTHLFSDLRSKLVTHGLTRGQMEEIYKWTGGKVDFRGIYSVDVDASSLDFTNVDGSLIYPDVPPPFFTTAADPELKDQWWIKELNVPAAWEMATGKGVVIADCDAGYHIAENDLATNLLLDFRYDLADKENPLVVTDGGFVYHGTAVAAIMSAVLDGKGTNGIAYDAKVVPLQNFNYDNSLDDLNKEEATAKCILHAMTVPEVKIIVLENQTQLGSSETYIGTREAVRLALAAGITIVSAGGNYSVELKDEAKDDTGSIIVGALAKNKKQASFSNYGDRVSVAAFGEQLRTLYGPGGAMGSFGGTSGATPQVAATVALMLEVNPALTPAQIKEILVKTRVESRDNRAVGGLLNSQAAVEMAKTTPPDTIGHMRSLVLLERVREVLAR